jgi:hypothetical protein
MKVLNRIGKRTKKLINLIILVMLLFAALLLSWNGFTDGHNWGGDFAAYIMQAQSILKGNPSKFIQENRFMIESSTRWIGPVAYPWGFPALLVPCLALFGVNMLALKSLNIIFYLFFLISLWLGFRRYHSRFWRIILVSLFALNPYFLRFMNNVLSDIPFLFFSTLSIFLIGRVVIQKRKLVSKIMDQVLLGILTAISFYIRSEGVLIIATLGVSQFTVVMKNIIDQQKEEATSKTKDILLRSFSNTLSNSRRFILPYFCFFLLTFIWRTVLPEGGSSHLSLIKSVSSGQIINHLLYYFNLPARFFTGLPDGVGPTLFGASLPLFIIGIVKRRNLDYHIIAYGALYILLLFIWPGRQGLRYLFPILPFYTSFVLTGVESIHDKSDEIFNAFWKVASVCSVIIIVAFFLRISIKDASNNLKGQRMVKTGPYASTSTDLFTFISNNTESDSIIVFFKPRVMRLFTNRQSLVIDQVDKVTQGDYLCLLIHSTVYKQIKKYDVISLLKDDKIRLLYQNVDFQLYRIIKP